MGRLPLIFLLLFFWAARGAVISKEPSVLDSCRDFKTAFERVFSVPGEAAVLHCTLDIHHLFNPANTSYNITWYDKRTGSEVTRLEHDVILRDKSLWFINITMEHQGNYICVVRTEQECFKQATVLMVNEMSENCMREQKAAQKINAHVNGFLACPLRSYLKSVDRSSIHWYKNCEEIEEDEKFVPMKDMLLIRNARFEDAGFYTCKMTFSLDDVDGEMSETLECEVDDKTSMKPRMVEPVNDVMKVSRGSSCSKRCRVFVPGKGIHLVEVLWKVRLDSEEYFVSLDVSDRVHQTPLDESSADDGVWMVRTLWLTEVFEEDFNQIFTCMVSSSRGHPTGQFMLLPTDPNLLLPLVLVLGSVAFLFMTGVLLYTLFKVELTLWVRNMFPFFYKTTDGDGKQFDAYVAYPRVLEGSSEMAEMFAMRTLPQVLEGQYGYKLFILGRDSLPGEAVVDVVEDALKGCRRLLLLYTASSLCSPEAQEWAEQQAGLYRALVENAIKIVLLEMEEIQDPRRLPESVRLIREKQGALQAWKRRKRWMCCDGTSEERVTSLHPSERFWREVRYYMPVRGKAKKRNVWFSF
ncbi:interleukin-1 receptor type 1 [Triplophysa rosa]|uniref:Interleukin-1 receptor type 1-like n=1 Tax=Triplophysa rosa TaxID=992332 RepID=A0A9W8C6V8_TRIRA|nr:interleukin-1 receptor type 1 [Triplophysa rosa]XP_057192082.1 interleukin-1 receptor type 1 [Triplophysa rosa]XP_057192083.1 interleukin-1 receptor type 1 [Triplophysa rosa]KAI7808753.1 putative interleukin-1 receptor type 1-like [Triplophysa rosa]